jgi:hypothetical protein
MLTPPSPEHPKNPLVRADNDLIDAILDESGYR